MIGSPEMYLNSFFDGRSIGEAILSVNLQWVSNIPPPTVDHADYVMETRKEEKSRQEKYWVFVIT